MTPFRQQEDNSEAIKEYNKMLSSARVVVENANALLKGKWRRLKKVNVLSSEKARLIIRACIILHNFVLKHDCDITTDSDNHNCQQHLPPFHDAASKRDAIARFLQSNND